MLMKRINLIFIGWKWKKTRHKALRDFSTTTRLQNRHNAVRYLSLQDLLLTKTSFLSHSCHPSNLPQHEHPFNLHFIKWKRKPHFVSAHLKRTFTEAQWWTSQVTLFGKDSTAKVFKIQHEIVTYQSQPETKPSTTASSVLHITRCSFPLFQLQALCWHSVSAEQPINMPGHHKSLWVVWVFF